MAPAERAEPAAARRGVAAECPCAPAAEPAASALRQKAARRRRAQRGAARLFSFGVGDAVTIVDGPFKDLDGKVGEVDESRGKVKVLVAMFGRETPVELDFLQIKRI